MATSGNDTGKEEGDERLGVRIFDYETVDEARQRGERACRKKRLATVGRCRAPGARSHHPAIKIGEAIADALDPSKAPSKAETFADMPPEKRAKMLELYGKK